MHGHCTLCIALLARAGELVIHRGSLCYYCLNAGCAVLVQECREGSASALQDRPACQTQAPLQEDDNTSSLDGWNSVVSTRQGLLLLPMLILLSGLPKHCPAGEQHMNQEKGLSSLSLRLSLCECQTALH